MADPQKHRSSRANHPDIRDILPTFISRLPAHVAQIRQSLAIGDTHSLLLLAHQLRGAGSSYGFDPISHHAAAIEDLLLAHRPLADTSPAVHDLITYIQNIDGYDS